MRNVADTPEVRGRERALAFLERFAELNRFFPSTSALAGAIGVTRDTILAWKRRDTSRVRQANELRVAQLLDVCLAATEHLPEDEQVGRWMQAPQTFLYGGTPIEFLADGGDPAFLIESMEPPVATVDDTALDALAAADQDLARLVPAARRQHTRTPARGGDQPAHSETVDLMEALRRSVAQEQELRARRGVRRRAQIVTTRQRAGGWVNIIEGRLVVPTLWRTKRDAERAGKRLAESTGASQVTLIDDERDVEHRSRTAAGRRR
jgi:uncharacterized protein (DUF2384 family)